MSEEPKREIPASPIKPLHDYVVVKRIQVKASKVLTLPGSDDGKFNAIVVAVGPGRVTDQVGPDGELLLNKPTCKVGDIVFMNPQAVHHFKLHGHEFAILNHFQVFGVLDEAVEADLEANAVGNLLTTKGVIHG